MTTLECYVIVWYFNENVRPMESEHFYTYYDAQRAAERILEDNDNSDIRFYKIEKRYVVR